MNPLIASNKGNHDRGDLLAEVFTKDRKHCYDTRHAEPGIVRAPRTRGDGDCHGGNFAALNRWAANEILSMANRVQNQLTSILHPNVT